MYLRNIIKLNKYLTSNPLEQHIVSSHRCECSNTPYTSKYEVNRIAVAFCATYIEEGHSLHFQAHSLVNYNTSYNKYHSVYKEHENRMHNATLYSSSQGSQIML